MELSQRPTSTYSNVEPSKDTSIPINYNKDFNYQNQQFDKQKFDQGFNSQPQLQQQLPQQQQGLIGSLAQNQQIPAPPSSNFNQNLSQQQSIHIPVQSASQGGNVQPSIVPASQSQGHAPQVTVPTAIPSQSSGTINETNLVSGSNQEYGSLITKLKTMIFGYESDYTNDPSFNAPLTLPSGIKTSITEIPDQLKKMLLEKEPTFDRDLPTKDFFKDLPEKEIIRHRVVHPVQVQTIMHTVVHPPKKIEIRHAAPHEVVHEVVHEIPHEIHHVVQHHVPFEVHHIVEHQVHDNVKHVMRHGVHQMVNHEIKEEIKQNIFHGINRMLAKGPVEAEIAEDNKIPHSVSRTTPFINQNITEKLLEDFSIGQGMKGIDFSQGGMKGIDFSQGGMNQGIQSSDSSLYSNLDKGKGILPGPTNTTVTERTVVDRSV